MRDRGGSPRGVYRPEKVVRRAVAEALEGRTLLAAAITGVTFNDLNGNGARDANEGGASGTWLLYQRVDAGESAPLHSTRADTQGDYAITGLAPGLYRVRLAKENHLRGLRQTFPAGDHWHELRVADGQTAAGRNFGIHDVPGAFIIGTVWNDHSGDGVRQFADAGLSGRTVYLDANNNAALDAGERTATTNDYGNYEFVDVAPQDPTYVVRQVVQASWRATAPLNVAHSATIGDNSMSAAGLDFGQTQQTLIQGALFHDANGNGTPDANEHNLYGLDVTHRVFLDTNLNGAADAGEPVTVVDRSGWYQFVGRPAGTYRITPLPGAGWRLTTPAAGYYDVTLGNFGAVATRHFGFAQESVRISGVVFEDNNRDGVRQDGEAGLSHRTVYLDADRDGVFDPGERSRETNMGGEYHFFGIPAGSYRVRSLVPASGVRLTAPAAGYHDVSPAPGQELYGNHFGWAAADVALRAAADAYVRDGSYAGTNYGGAADLAVRRSGTSGNSREAYLRFDLSSLGAFNSAKLRLFGRLSDTSNSSVTTTVYNAANTTWSESSTTWGNRPAAGTTSRGTITVSGTGGRWYELDLTSFLRAEKAAGRSRVTLVLKNLSTSTAHALFASDEHATAANRPQLVVRPVAPDSQGLEVSAARLTVPEGGNASFTVRLTARPALDLTVRVSKYLAGADPDLNASAATVTFTPANWNVPRTVTVYAGQDADTTSGSATYTVDAVGVAPKTVHTVEADDDVPGGPAPLLRAVADAYVRDGTYADTNLGGAPSLQVKQGGTGYNRQGYLRFDLSGVANVGSAKLRLYGRLDNTSAASAGFTVYNSSDTTWSEAGVTWNTKPAAGTTARGSGTVTGTTARWYEVDLTSFLRAEKSAGRHVVTLVLKATASSAATIIFESDEAANAPQLVVTA